MKDTHCYQSLSSEFFFTFDDLYNCIIFFECSLIVFYLSVFPMEGRAEGVSERGSFYELTDAVLTAGYPLGVSNEYADGSDCITISTRKGALVVVETVPDGPILS